VRPVLMYFWSGCGDVNGFEGGRSQAVAIGLSGCPKRTPRAQPGALRCRSYTCHEAIRMRRYIYTETTKALALAERYTVSINSDCNTTYLNKVPSGAVQRPGCKVAASLLRQAVSPRVRTRDQTISGPPQSRPRGPAPEAPHLPLSSPCRVVASPPVRQSALAVTTESPEVHLAAWCTSQCDRARPMTATRPCCVCKNA
jgi:hypothetical protein